MMNVLDNIIFFLIVVCAKFIDGRYGSRYFYNPFTDWDKEYFDASVDDLRIAAPPPPAPPDPPTLRADLSFDLPRIPLPNLPNIGPIPLPSIPGPSFTAVQTYSGPTIPFGASPLQAPLPIRFGGYGSFNGNYRPFPQNFGSYGNGLRAPGFNNFRGNFPPPPPFGGGGYDNGYGGNGIFPSAGGYDGFTGYSNRAATISGYNTPIIPPSGGFNNFPPDGYNNNFLPQPSSFSDIPLRQSPLPLPAVTFSNYDNNELLPQFPPLNDYNQPGPVANQGPLPVTFEKDIPEIPQLKPVVETVDVALKRERLCKPTGRPGLTGFCRHSFDIINNRVCNKMAVDSKARDCSDSEWCCYWRPKNTMLQVLPARALHSTFSKGKIMPGYSFVSRKSSDQNPSDYYNIGSHVQTIASDGDYVEIPVVPPDDRPNRNDVINVTIVSRPQPEAVERRLDAATRVVSRVVDEGSWDRKSCGRMGGSRRSGRVLNGDRALDGEFCWQVAIFLGNEYICGGALVDDIHVLTSAHCIQRFQKDNTGGSLKVILGTTNVRDMTTTSPCIQMFGISAINVHEAFNSKTLANDMAVLRLTNSVPANNCSCALCLPDSGTGSLKIDSNCLVTGYGLSSTTNPLSYGRLRSAPVQVINSSTGPVNCQMIMDAYSGMPVDYRLDPSMFCTLSRDKNYVNGLGVGDTCMRDGGSPLICALDRDDPQRWTLTGVVTWGLGCGRTTESIRMPSVYTNVRKQADWIRRNLN